MSRVSETFGNNVAFVRGVAGLTQQELADQTTVSRPAIANIEAGDQTPSLRTAIQIADAFGTSLDALCGRDYEADMQIAEAKIRVERMADELPEIREKLNQLLDARRTEDAGEEV